MGVAHRAILILAGVAALAVPAGAEPRDSVTIGMAQFPPDMHPYITNTSIRNTWPTPRGGT